jgi:hypothetical protein
MTDRQKAMRSIGLDSLLSAERSKNQRNVVKMITSTGENQ